MPTCQYEEWSRKSRCLLCCGAEAETVLLPKGRLANLCSLHKEFVIDAINDYEIRLHKLKEKQRKARIREQIKQLKLELKTGEWNNA